LAGCPQNVGAARFGHGDKKKSLKNLYLTLSDDDPIANIDMMKFDTGETEIRVGRSRSAWRMDAAESELSD
jgi:hypothetical protein